MESMNLLANTSVQPDSSKRASEMAMGVEKASDKKKMEVAKDFEAILVGQLMNQMKQTVGESGLLGDSSSKGVQDMFWTFLADEVADNGGMGLWKDVYQSMSPSDQSTKTGEDAKLKIDQTA